MTAVIDPSKYRKIPPGYITSRFPQIEFTDWIDEAKAQKETATLGDWSWIWDRRFKGPDALRLLRDTTVNSFENFAVLQSKHAIHTNSDGKVIGEGILTRVDEDEFVVMGRGSFWVDYQRSLGDYDVESSPEDWTHLQVAGPTSLKLLEKLSGTDLRDVKMMHNGEIEIAGHRLLALRMGMSGGPGFELQAPRAAYDEIYAALVATGEEFGLRELGGRAGGIGHVETAFPTIFQDYVPAIFDPDMTDFRNYALGSVQSFASAFSFTGSYISHDIRDYYRSPIELGWARNVKFDHQFIGREALEAEAAEPRRVLRTLKWNSDDVIDVYASMFREGEPYQFMDLPRQQRGTIRVDRVVANQEDVGVATMRGYSVHFREMLSLSVINVENAAIGNEVTVLWGDPDGVQKSIRATIAPAPYYDKRRDDLHKF